MKVIDLLNKIANGEELPKKIKYDNKIFEECGRDYHVYAGEWLFKDFSVEDILNDEIEIIEEPKKIEKLPLCLNLQHQQSLVANKVYENTLKINEIVDYVNNMEK